jgi:hypothetical protein
MISIRTSQALRFTQYTPWGCNILQQLDVAPDPAAPYYTGADASPAVQSVPDWCGDTATFAQAWAAGIITVV